GAYSTVNVLYFRGGGSGKELSEPTVNGSVIMESILSKRAFSSIFKSFTGTEPMFEQKVNEFNKAAAPFEQLKIPLTVLNTTIPFSIINSNLTFFWGNSSLPPNNTQSKNYQECYHYSLSNAYRAVTFCYVERMERCAANISDLYELDLLKFLSLKGETITQFSWLCPKGKICCAWECCDPALLTDWHVFVILCLAGIVLSALCATCCTR
ncbi:hypothetical protein PFISCL1PPCAC_2491, partial [Pristionchus fissidentatus]